MSALELGFAPELISKKQTLEPFLELNIGSPLLVECKKDQVDIWPHSSWSGGLLLWNILCVLGLALAVVYALEKLSAWGQERQNAIIIAVSVSILQIGSIIALLVARRNIKKGQPILRITREGVFSGRDVQYFKPWTEIDAVGGYVDQKKTEIVAVLTFEFQNSGVGIRLTTMAGKAKRIIDLCKDLRRRSAGVEVNQAMYAGTSLSCPYCLKESDSLKNIQYGSIVMIPLVYVSYKLTRTTCCMPCARQKLLADSVRNLLTCHVFWPIIWFGAVILPQSGKLLFRGHDKEALRDVL